MVRICSAAGSGMSCRAVFSQSLQQGRSCTNLAGHYQRSDDTVIIEAFGKTPLWHGTRKFRISLPCPRADIVPTSVAGYIRHGLFNGYVLARLSDNYAELAFVVGLLWILADFRNLDDHVWSG